MAGAGRHERLALPIGYSGLVDAVTRHGGVESLLPEVAGALCHPYWLYYVIEY